eukprot:gene8281-17037_t
MRKVSKNPKPTTSVNSTGATNSSRRRVQEITSSIVQESENETNEGPHIWTDNWKSALLCCGSNSFGQLCIGGMDLMSSTLEPSQINFFPKHISCGSSFTSAVTDQGELFVWGSGLPPTQYRIPTQINCRHVVSVSCGQSHASIITQDGKVYTWGVGDNGVLGHGSKQNVAAPKQVVALAALICVQVSCGAFHTGFIAGPPTAGGISYVDLPHVAASESDLSTIMEEDESEPSCTPGRAGGGEGRLPCGTLYTCGLGKVGQLGLADVRNAVMTPRPVSSLSTAGYRAAKVSCGMHHTLVLAVPISSSSSMSMSFTSTVFSFGWGEHGRLGVGDEDRRTLPTAVPFPGTFHAIDVAAGEQHSLAMSADSCFSWGSNEFGQLGIGGSSGSSSSNTDHSLTPLKIPLPEQMRVTKLRAGGRHSAALTSCGKLLSWGWGEEGQLGHGSEKSIGLPRPCRIPRIGDMTAVPVDLSLGMSHTIVLVRNLRYRPESPPSPTPDTPTPVQTEMAITRVESPVVPVMEDVVAVMPSTPPVEPVFEKLVLEDMMLMPMESSQRRSALMTEDDDDNEHEDAEEDSECESFPRNEPEIDEGNDAVRGVRDILSRKGSG